MFHRHFHKIRIAVILVAIRQRQFLHFNHRVDVIRRIEAHLLQVEAFQQAQRLQKIRTLRQRAGLIDRVATVRGVERIHHGSFVCGQICLAKETALFDIPGFQGIGDVSAIEAVRDGLQSPLPRTFRGLFRLHQFAKGHRHIRLPVHAGFDLLPAASIDIPTGAAGVQNG